MPKIAGSSAGAELSLAKRWSGMLLEKMSDDEVALRLYTPSLHYALREGLKNTKVDASMFVSVIAFIKT